MGQNGILRSTKSRYTQIGANNDYLISNLVNFSCELGQIMTIYDFLWNRQVILSNVTDSQLDPITLLVNFSYDLG